MTHTAGQLIRSQAHNTVYVHDPHSRSVDRNTNTIQCVHDPHSRSVDKDTNTTQCVHDTAGQLIRTQTHGTMNTIFSYTRHVS